MIVFDIETAPLPASEREQFKPEFSAPGNFKDPEKIQAAIAEKESAWNNTAALSALTGRVLCVGIWTPWTPSEGFYILDSTDERKVISETMDVLELAIMRIPCAVGFCCKSFDLPFLIQRAYRLGLSVPTCLRNKAWWSDEIIDLADVWNCPGNRNHISLDHLARALGVGSKNGDGKDFARLWEEDRETAVDYLRNDVELTRLCAERMGIK